MTEHVNAQSGAATPTDLTAANRPERERRDGKRRSGHDRRQWNLGPPDGMSGERRRDIERRQQTPAVVACGERLLIEEQEPTDETRP